MLKSQFCVLALVVTPACVNDEPSYKVAASAVTGDHGEQGEHGDYSGPGELPAPNKHGIAASVSTLGPIDGTSPFFQALGTNGRSCVQCHDPRSGWTISAELAKEVFNETDGLDPLFSIHDVGTRPDAPIATRSQRKAAFAPMTKAGLVRFPANVGATWDFEVLAVDDPYGYGTPAAFTRFRRPNITASESQVASLTWTAGPADVPTLERILFGIAVSFHSQGTTPVSDQVKEQAAAFILSVSHAQAIDEEAGPLDAGGARGGPVYLSQQPFFIGINTGASASRKVFDIYDAWEGSEDEARARIARGQAVFNFKEFIPAPGRTATCSGCHNAPNVGSGSTFRMINVGTDEVTERLTGLIPLVTVRNKTTGEVKVVTDFGRAASTGLWADLGKYKVPQLRGLASRSPYFHDGRAKDLDDVVAHYEAHFHIAFTGTEKEDLAAFLAAL
jgi:cytochrome c peroxidase